MTVKRLAGSNPALGIHFINPKTNSLFSLLLVSLQGVETTPPFEGGWLLGHSKNHHLHFFVSNNNNINNSSSNNNGYGYGYGGHRHSFGRLPDSFGRLPEVFSAHVVEHNNPAHHFLKNIYPLFSAAAQPSKLSFYSGHFLRNVGLLHRFFGRESFCSLNKISSPTSIVFRVLLSQLSHRITYDFTFEKSYKSQRFTFQTNYVMFEFRCLSYQTALGSKVQKS